MSGLDSLLLRAAAQLYSRLDQRVERSFIAVRHAVDGFLRVVLTPREKTDLTVQLYARGEFARGATLAPWEQEWFRRVLPAAPARVLLGGAGDGREAEWLLQAGYSVDAFEPSATHAAQLSRSLAGRADTTAGSYEQLIAAAAGAENSLSGWITRDYTAVILGWGSLTHVIVPGDQRRLLEVCDSLAPHGPVLASFWLRGPGTAPNRSRAHALGTMVGLRVGRLRGVANTASDGELFRTHCGFAYEFTRAEIEAHAAAIGRAVEWGEYGYPHVTLVKSSARR